MGKKRFIAASVGFIAAVVAVTVMASVDATNQDPCRATVGALASNVRASKSVPAIDDALATKSLRACVSFEQWLPAAESVGLFAAFFGLDEFDAAGETMTDVASTFSALASATANAEGITIQSTTALIVTCKVWDEESATPTCSSLSPDN